MSGSTKKPKVSLPIGRSDSAELLGQGGKWRFWHWVDISNYGSLCRIMSAIGCNIESRPHGKGLRFQLGEMAFASGWTPVYLKSETTHSWVLSPSSVLSKVSKKVKKKQKVQRWDHLRFDSFPWLVQ